MQNKNGLIMSKYLKVIESQTLPQIHSNMHSPNCFPLQTCDNVVQFPKFKSEELDVNKGVWFKTTRLTFDNEKWKWELALLK